MLSSRAVVVALLGLTACRRDEDIARPAGPTGTLVAEPVRSTAPAESARPGAMPSLFTDAPHGALEIVATFDGPMPTGVTVSKAGRVFVNYPRWGDPVTFTVAEVTSRPSASGDVTSSAVAYPSEAVAVYDAARPTDTLRAVQSVVVDASDRLWALDTGSELMGPPQIGAAKLVGVDLATNKVVKTIVFEASAVLPTTYLNDVRFDLRRGKEGMAFITDSSKQPGTNAIIVVDLATGKARRRLHGNAMLSADPKFTAFVEGAPVMTRKPGQPPQPISMGADGIAISPDGKTLYVCTLASRRLLSIDVDALADDARSDADVAKTLKDLGYKPASDGLETHPDGRVVLTAYEHNAILLRNADGTFEPLVHDARMLSPDTMSVAANGFVYFTSNQLHRQPDYQNGKDERRKPYVVFRIRLIGQP